jgi:hypothetical protein
MVIITSYQRRLVLHSDTIYCFLSISCFIFVFLTLSVVQGKKKGHAVVDNKIHQR